LREHIGYLEKENKNIKTTINRETPLRGAVGHHKNSSSALEELSYHQNIDNFSTDCRNKKYMNVVGGTSTTTNTNYNGQMTSSSGISGISSTIFKT
jgi:hypothetical protein